LLSNQLDLGYRICNQNTHKKERKERKKTKKDWKKRKAEGKETKRKEKRKKNIDEANVSISKIIKKTSNIVKCEKVAKESCFYLSSYFIILYVNKKREKSQYCGVRMQSLQS